MGLSLEMIRNLQLVKDAAARKVKEPDVMLALYMVVLCPIPRISSPKWFGTRVLAGPPPLYQPHCALRGAGEALLTLPSVTEARLRCIRLRALSVVVPFLWNALPPEACQAGIQVKAELFGQAFIY